MKKFILKFILYAVLFLLSGNAYIFANAGATYKVTTQSTFSDLQLNHDNLVIHSVPFNSENENGSIESVEFETEEESLVVGYIAPFNFDNSFEFGPYFARNKIKYYTAPSRYNLTSRKYLLYQVFLI